MSASNGNVNRNSIEHDNKIPLQPNKLSKFDNAPKETFIWEIFKFTPFLVKFTPCPPQSGPGYA
jgi:hypothetical protein